MANCGVFSGGGEVIAPSAYGPAQLFDRLKLKQLCVFPWFKDGEKVEKLVLP